MNNWTNWITMHTSSPNHKQPKTGTTKTVQQCASCQYTWGRWLWSLFRGWCWHTICHPSMTQRWNVSKWLSITSTPFQSIRCPVLMVCSANAKAFPLPVLRAYLCSLTLSLTVLPVCPTYDAGQTEQETRHSLPILGDMTTLTHCILGDMTTLTFALRTLQRDDGIVIVPAHKGRATVVMDKMVYERKVEDLLQISTPTKCFALYQEPAQFIMFPALVAQHHMG